MAQVSEVNKPVIGAELEKSPEEHFANEVPSYVTSESNQDNRGYPTIVVEFDPSQLGANEFEPTVKLDGAGDSSISTASSQSSSNVQTING